MPSFKIAHIHEQGADIIIVPLESAFGNKSLAEQNMIRRDLQHAAATAGLAGVVVPVWNDAFGTFFFISPRNWENFFKSINMNFVLANINRTLSW